MKILYTFRQNQDKSVLEKNEIDIVSKALKLDIKTISQGEITNFWLHKTKDEVDNMYKNRDENLFRLYDYTLKLIDKWKPDIFIVNHDNLYHNDFIKQIKDKVYTVFVSGDDPENSENCSKPYVSAYHQSFAWGVWYDANHKIIDKFKQWGAPQADIWPHGVYSSRHNPDLPLEELINKPRKKDIVFVGSPYLKRERLKEIKNHFGSSFELHGRWVSGSWKRKILRHIKTYYEFGQFITPLSEKNMIALYQNTKVGLNMHLSFGPSNLRTFELMANGVAQVVDCKQGIDEWFDIGKDLLVYEDTKEAIELMNKLLKNDDYRKEIAYNGAKKVREKYTFIKTFTNMINNVKQNIKNINE
jgi:spore maturation protein CgeB